MQRSECLTSDQLNIFLAGQGSPGERGEVEFHLNQCRTCRQQLVSLYETPKTDTVSVRAPGWLKRRAQRIPQHRQGLLPFWILKARRQVAAALAAGLVVGLTSVLLWRESRPGDRPPTVETLRREAEMLPAPQLLAPGAGSVLVSDQIEFRWSPVSNIRRYTFTLLDEKGDIIFQTTTTEERLTISRSSIRVENGKTYFWYVGANLPDGTTVDSEMRKLVLSRE
jgi:hypothetical protein